VGKPLTLEVVLQHMRGDITVAVYQLEARSDHVPLARTALLDFDTPDGVQRAMAVWKTLRSRWLTSLLELSREGRAHLWLFFEDPLPAPLVRRAMTGTLAAAGVDTEGVEIFPKSEWLSPDQWGNTTRLPLGLHRKCDPPTRFGFYDPETGREVSRKWEAQAAHLASVNDTSVKAVEALAALAPEPAPVPTPSPQPRRRSNGTGHGEGVIARLNAAMLSTYGSLAGVVTHYHQAPDAKNWVRCPFHEDRKPSMRVDERWQRAVCYVCTPQRPNLRYATFDAFEFVAQVRFNGDKKTAVRVLAEELL
jgi:hypothetical protein